MKVKYLIIIIAIIFALTLIYLNRSYAYIYNRIDKSNLQNPNMQQSYLLEAKNQNSKIINYVALGDSLTAGVGSTDYKQTLPYLLAENLSQKGAVNLNNLAVPGAKTKDVIAYQLNQAIALNPDYITLLVGVNDVHGLVSLKKFQTEFQKIIDQLSTKTKAKIIIINIPYLGTSNLILPPYNWYFDKMTKNFNEAIKQTAAKKSLYYIDLYSQTKDSFAKNKKLYSSDFFHPSNEGYKIWAQIIYANSSCFAN